MSTSLLKNRFVVYADFNCPFCYALNELIHTLGLAADVEWRVVQHAVNATSSLCSFESLSEITSEVNEVRRRAPATDIRAPVFRPNSALASRVITQAARIDTEKAIKLRRSIYRALWVDAKDISKADVLTDLLRANELELSLDDIDTEDELVEWQHEWDSSDYFERNIPITLDQSGAAMIGLPAQMELEIFLRSGTRNAVSAMHAVCAIKPKQRILVMDSDPKSIRIILEQMRNYQVDVVSDITGLGEQIERHGVPDLIMLDASTLGVDPQSDWYQSLVKYVLKGEAPVILMSRDADPQAEVAAFESGVVDFFVKPFHPNVLKARLTLNLDKSNAEKMLVHQARYDSLTGIPNRRAFSVQFQIEWDRGIRTRSPLGLLMIDIDYFKAYNDHYGHIQGDACLTAVAQVLEHSIRRPGDFLARYGGEEFVVLLPETDLNGVLHVAERCCHEVKARQITHEFSEISSHLSISIGVAACLPEQGRSIHHFIKKADACLYEAKQHGRNRVRSCD